MDIGLVSSWPSNGPYLVHKDIYNTPPTLPALVVVFRVYGGDLGLNLLGKGGIQTPMAFQRFHFHL